MKNYNLNISAPTDGRYSGLCKEINNIFSEHNLIKMRVKVEIEWFIFLSNQKGIESYQDYQNLKLVSSGTYTRTSVQKIHQVSKKLKTPQNMM